MEEIIISASIQLKIDHLDDRIKKFELMLDEQMSELGAGKIVKALRSALKQCNGGIVFVSFEVLHRLMFYKFIKTDAVNGIHNFDESRIYASNAMPNDTFIIIPVDLQLDAHISFDSYTPKCNDNLSVG